MSLSLESSAGLVGALLVLLVLLCSYCLLLLDNTPPASAEARRLQAQRCRGEAESFLRRGGGSGRPGHDSFLERQPYELGCSERWGSRRRRACRGLTSGEMPSIEPYPFRISNRGEVAAACNCSCLENSARIPAL